MKKESKWIRFSILVIIVLFMVQGAYGSDKMVALTFDDGPNGNTDTLLDILKEEDVTATFFVVGRMVEKYPQLLEEIFNRGHEISNHTYSHPNLTMLSAREVIYELDKTRGLVREVIGKDPHFFRPPGGRYNQRILKIAEAAGYTMVMWDINTDDLISTPEKIYREIVNYAEDGDIVLLHNGTTSTIEIIGKVIDELRKKGFGFVTVSEILKRRNIKGAYIGNRLWREEDRHCLE